MHLEKLEHFFPEPAVRKLDRCRYKVPKDDDFLEELNILIEKIM